jgi:hypothetical protein
LFLGTFFIFFASQIWSNSLKSGQIQSNIGGQFEAILTMLQFPDPTSPLPLQIFKEQARERNTKVV